MNFEEALKEVGKYEPCPHDAVVTNLGNGKEWARCEDCGESFRQSSLPALREANRKFREALVIIATLYHDSDRVKIEQAIRLLNETMTPAC